MKAITGIIFVVLILLIIALLCIGLLVNVKTNFFDQAASVINSILHIGG